MKFKTGQLVICKNSIDATETSVANIRAQRMYSVISHENGFVEILDDNNKIVHLYPSRFRIPAQDEVLAYAKFQAHLKKTRFKTKN